MMIIVLKPHSIISRSVSRTEDKGTRGLVGDAAHQWWLLHEHSREGSRGKQQSDSCQNLVSVFFFFLVGFLFELSLGDFQENRVTDYQKTPRVIGSDPAINLVFRKNKNKETTTTRLLHLRILHGLA